MQDYQYAFENAKNSVAIRNSIQKLGKTVETDIYLHIYGNIIPTYHFNGKLLVAPEDMFFEAQRIRKTREEYNYYSQKFLIDFYVTAKYDPENRSLNVYTDKETFENTEYLPGVTLIEKYKDYKNWYFVLLKSGMVWGKRSWRHWIRYFVYKIFQWKIIDNSIPYVLL